MVHQTIEEEEKSSDSSSFNSDVLKDVVSLKSESANSVRNNTKEIVKALSKIKRILKN